jgi:predicted RNA-binding protein with RPS1 domain
MKISKGDFSLKLEIIDLDEIPDVIDISIKLPENKPTEETKRPKKGDSIPLF